MSKYLVETYYTCTFKIVHKLNELNEKELSKLEKRNDGNVEITDVKQVEGISGIGAGSQKRIKEILDTGKLAELVEYDEMIEERLAKKQIIDELKNVHGIGEVTAVEDNL